MLTLLSFLIVVNLFGSIENNFTCYEISTKSNEITEHILDINIDTYWSHSF